MTLGRILLVAAALLVLAAALIYGKYRSELSAARRDLLAGSRIAHTACGPVEYAVAGSGPAVLVIRGGYSQVAALGGWLAASGFKAIAMSYCLRHAARCPALVLLVPAIPVPGRSAADTTPPSAFWQFVFDYVLRSDFTIWAITRAWPEMLVETVLATPVEEFHRASSAERQRGLGIIRDIFPVSLKADGLTNDARLTTPAPIPQLERIAAPTLAISAEDDLYRTAAGARYAAVRDEVVTFLTGARS